MSKRFVFVVMLSFVGVTISQARDSQATGDSSEWVATNCKLVAATAMGFSTRGMKLTDTALQQSSYCIGLFNGAITATFVSVGRLSRAEENTWCAPSAPPELFETQVMFFKWLREHPEYTKYPAAGAITLMLYESWICKH